MTYSYADMHCDTLLRGYEKGIDSLYNGEGHINFQKMAEGDQLLQFFAVFFPPRHAFDSFQMKAPNGSTRIPDDDEFFDHMVQALQDAVTKYPDKIALARTAADVTANHAAGKSSAILTIEDGRFVNGDMDKLTRLHDLGVRAIALTWNYDNCFGAPNSFDPKLMQKGLTDFGKAAVSEMEHLGILIDTSHLSEGGFYDVAELSSKPFIASHSNCRTIANHPRNLTDEQIRILADNGGVMGLNFYQDFVVPGTRLPKNSGVTKALPETSINDLVLHVQHAYEIGGEDVIALGTDFDGFDGTPEIDGPDKMHLLFEALEQAGFTPRVLDKFASGNVLRVLS